MARTVNFCQPTRGQDVAAYNENFQCSHLAGNLMRSNFMVNFQGFPESNSAWSLGLGFSSWPLFGWPEFCSFENELFGTKNINRRRWSDAEGTGYHDFWSDESSVDPFFWTSFHCYMIHLSLDIEMHTETEVNGVALVCFEAPVMAFSQFRWFSCLGYRSRSILLPIVQPWWCVIFVHLNTDLVLHRVCQQQHS